MIPAFGGLIGGALSLVGAGLAGSSARRRGRRATRTAEAQRDETRALMPTNGFSIATGQGGPSFTFGGTPGSAGSLVGSAAAPNGGTLAFGTQGQTNQPGIFLDQATGVIFDGLTGEAITDGTHVGGGQSFLDINIPDFTGGGASGGPNGQLFALAQDFQGLQADFAELAGEFETAGGDYSGRLLDISASAGDLLPRVEQGASEMREARLNEIENQRQSTLSNLQDSMARRRLSGSSFANDSIARAEAEFAQQTAQANALSTLEEISATTQILSFQQGAIESAGNYLLNALAGQGQALQGELAAANSELATLEQISENTQFSASLRLQQQQAQFNAEATALSLAFQGYEMATDYILNLQALVNGASEAVISAMNNQSSVDLGIMNGLLGFGLNSLGGFFSGGGEQAQVGGQVGSILGGLA